MRIIDFFEKVTDKRGLQGRRYRCTGVLLLLLISRLCGYQGIKAAWRLGNSLNRRHLKALGFKQIPTYQCMLYILQKLEVGSVESAISGAMAELSPARHSRLLSVDGKRLRGSGADVDSAIHLVSMLRYCDLAVCGQVESGYGGGEIEAAAKLIESVDIKGKIITGDAQFANQRLCELICKNGGDYVFTLKNNQKKLAGDIELAFEKSDESSLRLHSEKLQKHHGRLEKRSITATDMPWEYNNDWSTIRQIGKINRYRWNKKTESTEKVLCISSLRKEDASPAQLLACNRGHWAIENRLHRTRDTLFDEDRNRLRTAQTPQINAAISNFAIFLCKRLNSSITAATQACATNLNIPFQLIGEFF